MLLAALSGLLLTGAFPKIGLDWLAWFALVPLLAAIANLSVRKSFRIGFITGLEIYLSRPFRNIFITDNAGGILITTCTITSGLLLIGLSILLITPIKY